MTHWPIRAWDNNYFQKIDPSGFWRIIFYLTQTGNALISKFSGAGGIRPCSCIIMFFNKKDSVIKAQTYFGLFFRALIKRIYIATSRYLVQIIKCTQDSFKQIIMKSQYRFNLEFICIVESIGRFQNLSPWSEQFKMHRSFDLCDSLYPNISSYQFVSSCQFFVLHICHIRWKYNSSNDHAFRCRDVFFIMFCIFYHSNIYFSRKNISFLCI